MAHPFKKILMVTPGHSHYPARLLPLSGHPKNLYLLGDVQLLQGRPMIGIVGTRRPSHYALSITRRLVEQMKPWGPVIVSGMAMGIDAAAHQAALDHGLKTIGVLGCPVNVVYPQQNQPLYARVKREGLLVSEFAPGSPIYASHFPARNRIIAGLSHAVIVVEAPEKSGALITAGFAADYDRAVFVVPGPITMQKNLGGHRLIQDGAHLLYDVEEMFKILKFEKTFGVNPAHPRHPGLVIPAKAGTHDAGAVSPVLDFLTAEPIHIDKIITMSHEPPNRVVALLSEATLAGVVEELPGKFFVRTES